MKKHILTLTKRELFIGTVCLLVGAFAVFMYTKTQLSSNKRLTSRILSNAIGSMEASQSLAESCSEAYNTATACVTHLNTCNLNDEAKKLDEYNAKRKHADEQINARNEEMEKIIEEMKNSQ